MRYLFYFSQVCFFSSCMYYSLAGSIPAHINSVAIPIVENQTAEFGMSESVTENLLAKFNEENILRVTDENNASSVLNATITRVTDAPYTFTKQEAVTEYRFTIHMKIEWYDIINEKILLQKSFSGWGAYGLSGDISSDGIDNDGDGFGIWATTEQNIVLNIYYSGFVGHTTLDGVGSGVLAGRSLNACLQFCHS